MAITEVEYAVVEGQSLKLDVRPPTKVPPGASPAVVAVHGGGWSSGTKADDLLCWDALAAAGLTVFSVDYRLAPQFRWPACIDDVRAAIRWVLANGPKHGSSVERVGLLGYSAGGHLAATAAVVETFPAVAAVALMAAPTDLVLDNFRRGGLSKSMQDLFGRPEKPDADVLETLWRTSPINYLKPGLPPFLLLNGTNDQSVPHSQSAHFHQRCSDLGIPSDLISLNGAGHRLREWKEGDPTWPQRIAEFFARTLAPPARPATQPG
jgi:alpha-L-fucosidase 2